MNAAELPQGKSYVGRLTLTMRDHTQANPPKEPPKELFLASADVRFS
jgi:hypothetical protein